MVSVSGRTDIEDGHGKVIGKTPERPDGTLVVRHRSGYRMIQNHEASPGAAFPVPLVDGTVYDPGALGDGSLLFGNVQEPGHVFAISGPWKRHLG